MTIGGSAETRRVWPRCVYVKDKEAPAHLRRIELYDLSVECRDFDVFPFDDLLCYHITGCEEELKALLVF